MRPILKIAVISIVSVSALLFLLTLSSNANAELIPFQEVFNITGSPNIDTQKDVLPGVSSIDAESPNYGDVSPFYKIAGGHALAMGDVNGDGISDLVVGAPRQDDSTSCTNCGNVTVYFGSGESTPNGTADVIINGPQISDIFFGVSVTCGDFNGDGIDDISIGSMEERKVYLFYGRNSWNSIISYSDASIVLSSSSRNFGFALGCANVNGDTNASNGKPFYDLLVCARDSAVFVFLGSNNMNFDTDDYSYFVGERIKDFTFNQPTTKDVRSDCKLINADPSTWWDLSWHYRINITINTGEVPRINTTISKRINFADILSSLGDSGTIDQNSIRVINSTGREMDSQVVRWLAAGDGMLKWKMNGTYSKLTNYTYSIYFDILENGAKSQSTGYSLPKEYFIHTGTGSTTGFYYAYSNYDGTFGTWSNFSSGDSISDAVIADFNNSGRYDVAYITDNVVKYYKNIDDDISHLSLKGTYTVGSPAQPNNWNLDAGWTSWIQSSATHAINWQQGTDGGDTYIQSYQYDSHREGGHYAHYYSPTFSMFGDYIHYKFGWWWSSGGCGPRAADFYIRLEDVSNPGGNYQTLDAWTLSSQGTWERNTAVLASLRGKNVQLHMYASKSCCGCKQSTLRMYHVYVSDASGNMAKGQWGSISAGDFNADGLNDIIACSPKRDLYLLKNNGDDTFTKTPLIGLSSVTAHTKIAVGDFDNDKKLDFVLGTSTGGIYFFKGNGEGSFTNLGTISNSSTNGFDSHGIWAIDDDQDGDLDLYVKQSATAVYYFRSNGNGTFQNGTTTSTLNHGYFGSGTVLDVNCDGNLDLTEGKFDLGVGSVWYGTGTPSSPFGSPTTIVTTGGTRVFFGGPEYVKGLSIAENITSNVFDAGETVCWSNISWNESLSTGADVTLQVRISMDKITWSNWSPVISTANGSGIMNGSGLSTGRYIQWRATVTAPLLLNTPVLNDVTFNYSTPPKWVQTGKEDFSNGEISNVDINSSAGEVTLNIPYDILYKYLKPISITNTGSQLIDYRIMIQNPVYNENGLVGSWHFNEGSGTTAADTSSYGNTGTLTSGPTWVDGTWGKALSFNGVNEYVSVPDSSSLDITGSITISAWINPPSNPTDGGGFIAAKIGAYYLEMTNTGVLRTYFYGLSTPGYHYGTNTIPLGTWSYVTVVYDQYTSEIRTYINGNPDKTISGITGSITNSGSALQMGEYSGGGYEFNGIIDEVRIYNRALSLLEIQQHYDLSTRKTRLDYGDIRFTDSNGGILDYWQQGENKFGVKIPSLPTGTTVIYIYYGNSSATSASTGNTVYGAQPDNWNLDSYWTSWIQSSATHANNWQQGTDAGDTYIQSYQYDSHREGGHYAHYYSPAFFMFGDYIHYKFGWWWTSGGCGPRAADFYIRLEDVSNPGGNYQTLDAWTLSSQGTWERNTAVASSLKGKNVQLHMYASKSCCGCKYSQLRIYHVYDSDASGNMVPVPTVSIGGEELNDLNSPTGAFIVRKDQYSPSGTFISRILDAGQVVKWDNLSWNADVPIQTNLSFKTRTSIDNSSWSDWSYNITNGKDIQSPAGRYIQWRADLNTSDGACTPILEDVATRIKFYSIGYSIANINDVDGDGKDDVVLGCPEYNVSKDAVLVIKGSTITSYPIGSAIPLNNSEIIWLTENYTTSSSEFGFSVAAGDINNDCLSDIEVGAPYKDIGGKIDRGVVYVFYSPTSNKSNSSADIMLTGEVQSRGLFGWRVGVDDAWHIGKNDIIVTAPYLDKNYKIDNGAVYWFKNSNLTNKSASSAEISVYGESEDENLGMDLALGGNMIAKPYKSAVVSSTFDSPLRSYNNQGKVKIFILALSLDKNINYTGPGIKAGQTIRLYADAVDPLELEDKLTVRIWIKNTSNNYSFAGVDGASMSWDGYNHYYDWTILRNLTGENITIKYILNNSQGITDWASKALFTVENPVGAIDITNSGNTDGGETITIWFNASDVGDPDGPDVGESRLACKIWINRSSDGYNYLNDVNGKQMNWSTDNHYYNWSIPLGEPGNSTNITCIATNPNPYNDSSIMENKPYFAITKPVITDIKNSTGITSGQIKTGTNVLFWVDSQNPGGGGDDKSKAYIWINVTKSGSSVTEVNGVEMIFDPLVKDHYYTWQMPTKMNDGSNIVGTSVDVYVKVVARRGTYAERTENNHLRIINSPPTIIDITHSGNTYPGRTVSIYLDASEAESDTANVDYFHNNACIWIYNHLGYPHIQNELMTWDTINNRFYYNWPILNSYRNETIKVVCRVTDNNGASAEYTKYPMFTITNNPPDVGIEINCINGTKVPVVNDKLEIQPSVWYDVYVNYTDYEGVLSEYTGIVPTVVMELRNSTIGIGPLPSSTVQIAYQSATLLKETRYLFRKDLGTSELDWYEKKDNGSSTWSYVGLDTGKYLDGYARSFSGVSDNVGHSGSVKFRIMLGEEATYGDWKLKAFVLDAANTQNYCEIQLYVNRSVSIMEVSNYTVTPSIGEYPAYTNTSSPVFSASLATQPPSGEWVEYKFEVSTESDFNSTNGTVLTSDWIQSSQWISSLTDNTWYWRVYTRVGNDTVETWTKSFVVDTQPPKVENQTLALNADTPVNTSQIEWTLPRNIPEIWVNGTIDYDYRVIIKINDIDQGAVPVVKESDTVYKYSKLITVPWALNMIKYTIKTIVNDSANNTVVITRSIKDKFQLGEGAVFALYSKNVLAGQTIAIKLSCKSEDIVDNNVTVKVYDNEKLVHDETVILSAKSTKEIIVLYTIPSASIHRIKVNLTIGEYSNETWKELVVSVAYRTADSFNPDISVLVIAMLLASLIYSLNRRKLQLL